VVEASYHESETVLAPACPPGDIRCKNPMLAKELPSGAKRGPLHYPPKPIDIQPSFPSQRYSHRNGCRCFKLMLHRTSRQPCEILQ